MGSVHNSVFFLWGGTTPETLIAAEQVFESRAASLNINEANIDNFVTEDLASKVNLTGVRSYLDQIDQDLKSAVPDFSLSNMFDELRQGKIDLQPEKIGKNILVFLSKETLKSAPLIGKLLILAVLIAVLQQLQSAFNGNIAKMAQGLSYLALMGIAIAVFQQALDLAVGSIQEMTGFMQSLFPVMMTLLLAMGNVTAAALFKPIVLGSLTFLATLIKTVVLPLFFLAAVIKIFNNISGEFKLGKLAGLFEFAGKMSLGIALTVFIGVMAIQGVTGGVTDGIVLRTAKYSADLIPVVGKFFKDAVELVASSGLLLKNALGVVAIIAISLICLAPAVKITALILIFRISAALIEPLGQKELADSLQDMAKSLIFIFASVASVSIMFFIAVAVVVGTGNFTVMLR